MWRRQKVIELKARGMNHSEIARELQVTRQCIVADVHYLRDQAKDSIKVYATEYLPEQYQICLTALDEIIKRAFDILEHSNDDREKLSAMELFKETHLEKLDLLSNATTIENALSFIRNKKQSNQQEEQEQQDNEVITEEQQEQEGNA